MSGARIFMQQPAMKTNGSEKVVPNPARRAPLSGAPEQAPREPSPGWRGFDLSSVPAYGPEGPREHPMTVAERQFRMIQRARYTHLQAKLQVGAVDDPLEREADRVAHAVVSGNLVAAASNTAGAGTAQRQCAACEEKDSTDTVQRKSALAANSTGVSTADAPASVEKTLRSPGRPLDASAREFMEPRFGRDFGDVRIHDGGMAHESAHAVRAKAYTVGKDIVFGAGQYDAATTEGRTLLAHELAHVVQQGGAQAVVQRESTDAEPDLESGAVLMDDDASDGDTAVLGLGSDLVLETDETKDVVRLQADKRAPTDKKPARPAPPTIDTIDVHQDKQRMTVHYSDGTSETHAVSTGRGKPNTEEDPCKTQGEQNCTPNGTFTISSKGDGNTKNSEGDAMSWYVGFVDGRGIGIHDSQPVPGVPHSHGCVRVGNSPADDAFAKKINQRVVVGKTKVVVSGKAPTKPWKKAVKAKPKPSPKEKPKK